MSDFVKSVIMYVMMAFVGIFFLSMLVTTGCTRIEPGYTGIKVNLTGSQRGADELPIVTGWVVYNRFLTQVHEFPTFTQNIVWTQTSGIDGTNEAITFNSTEGTSANADVTVSYTMESEKIPHIFIEIRRDVDYINHTYIRTRVQDAFARHASGMKMVDIFGPKKSELLDKVKNTLKEEIEDKGFKIELVGFIGKFRLDPKVEESINSTISATQRAIEAQNKIVQSKAEADQKIEDARGQAESALLLAKSKSEANLMIAKAQAESTLINAEAQAKANELLTKSLTSELILYQATQVWNGVTPTVVTADAGQFLMQLQTPKEVK